MRKPHADRLRVALAFPNTYFVGMSNLGFQTIYRLFNDQPDIVCERVFLPPKQELKALLESGARLVTLESQTPVSDFDVFAFSVSFEWDYTNVLTLLRLAGIPLRAADRDYRHPLVVIGGAVTFVNPEPLALFADVIAAGEGEVAGAGAGRRRAAPRRVARDCCGGWPPQRGFYIPSFYDVEYDADGTIARYRAARRHRRAAGRAEGRAQDHRGRRSAGDQHLHARHRVRLALPHRGRARLRQPVPLLLGGLQLPAGARVSDRSDPRSWRSGARRTPTRVGLVSIALCDHPDIEHILRSLKEMGYSISPASLRLDDLTPTIVSLLQRERRADADDRARNRLRPAAPGDQQDGDQRRDPRPRRADLLAAASRT